MLINQALHGYNQGHNLLASSMIFSIQDDDMMKMLSDWSEYSGCKDTSYITSYPLSDGKHYVVAKSWYADDMDRPGCVWTHSLIIDLSQLDDNFDFRLLQSFFRRPLKGEYSSYSIPIKYDSRPSFIEKKDYSIDTLIGLYSRLINRDDCMIFQVEQDSMFYQNLVLLMMQYLPLEILKKKSMCSGSASGRKYNRVDFNLQFAISLNNKLNSIESNAKPQCRAECMGLISICKSMLDSSSDTSIVLRLFSSDIKDNPRKLCAIGFLLSFLDDVIKGDHSHKFSEILSLLTEYFPSFNEGGLVKATFCKRKVSNLFSSEIDVLALLVTALPNRMIDYESIDYSKRVLALKQEFGIETYAKYLKILVESPYLNDTGVSQIKKASDLLEFNECLYLANNDWSTYMSLLLSNPNILQYDFWVDLPENKFVLVYDIFKANAIENFNAWDRLFQIVLYRNHSLNKYIFEKFVKHVQNITLEVMEYLNTSIEYKLSDFFKTYCENHILEILNWLALQKQLTVPSITFMIDTIIPNSDVVIARGSEIWNVFDREDRLVQHSYYVFLFLLGHNWKDVNSLQFLRHSFYVLHETLAKSCLSDSLWKKIEPYTVKLNFWQEWDKCKKLRKGLVKYLKANNYAESVLDNFTPNGELNEALLRIWNS